MTTLKLNREFLVRHLAVCLTMLGMSLWFAYDGAVTYPRTPAAELYESIEKSAPAEGYDVERFKAQKIRRQYEFASLAMLASVLIGLHLASTAAFRFAYGDGFFVWRNKKYPLSDIKSVDRAKWEKKGLVAIRLENEKIVLDAWHHTGVKEFEKMV